jgi:hypothetical protein
MKFILICICFLFGSSIAQNVYESELVEVELENDTNVLKFVKTPELVYDSLIRLAQPVFWQEVMQTSADTIVWNIASTRKVIERMPRSIWDSMSDKKKDSYRDSLRKWYSIADSLKIYRTVGKGDFYHFDLVFPSITNAVDVFMKDTTDPWYAQAILMIESPGKIAYSSVGALGPFQLMKSVARKYGLKINKYVDERKDFKKSAKASAALIRKSCIPEAIRILNKFDIEVRPEDQLTLWFRLLVLHIYHAGAGNVNNVLTNVVKPKEGGMNIITSMWQAEYGGFKNASQNYSQIALAATLILEGLIENKAYVVKDCAVN